MAEVDKELTERVDHLAQEVAHLKAHLWAGDAAAHAACDGPPLPPASPAAAHLALLVPVALAWHWVGAVWGLFALALAWTAAISAERPGLDAGERRALAVLAWAGFRLYRT